jgi:hypothetical protein
MEYLLTIFAILGTCVVACFLLGSIYAAIERLHDLSFNTFWSRSLSIAIWLLLIILAGTIIAAMIILTVYFLSGGRL